MLALHCTNCGRSYPGEGSPYRCLTCGGLFDFSALPAFDPQDVEHSTEPGIWRYRGLFGLPDAAPAISLGEGNTPLVWKEVQGRTVGFKLEYENPTGSFKDRGSAVLLSFLRSRGVTAAVEDSSGNAGASFAAYAQAAGVQARVFVPEAASGPKREQIVQYAADLVPVPGPRSSAADAVQAAAREGAVYASHAYLPHLIPGYATAAYEIVAQMQAAGMGQAPGTVIVPAGMGNFLLALGRGFAALQAGGTISELPRLVGVQARACAPLWAVYHYGPSGLSWVSENPTLAEGVRIKIPLRGDAVLHQVADSRGTFVAVDEEEILPGRDQLARLGLSVEPTSAITWSALHQVAGKLPDPIVVVLTGAGWKSSI